MNRRCPCYDNMNHSMVFLDYGPEPFVINIDQVTKQNITFRTALWTGNHLQLSLMSNHVGEDIGSENHSNLDSFCGLDKARELQKWDKAGTI